MSSDECCHGNMAKTPVSQGQQGGRNVCLGKESVSRAYSVRSYRMYTVHIIIIIIIIIIIVQTGRDE